jgi:hypothetical protein
MGQKRMFAGEFRKLLQSFDDRTVFIDLFGGSGLLSHLAKREKPLSTVVFNDYDNYKQRLDNIPRTNALLADLRHLAEACPRTKRIPSCVKEAILERIASEEHTGFVDYITLSSSLLFSMKYRLSLDALRKEAFYNTIRLNDYNADGYLDGLTIVRKDYKELFAAYKDVPGVVFLVDPPYLSTEVGSYTMDSWRLSDYLDVLTVLCGTSYVYFTSNKSSIIDLCGWMEAHQDFGNPFSGATKKTFSAHMNYNSGYTDIMLYKQADAS